MACDRCEDIHKAQREGKTNQKCECDCHYSSSGGGLINAQICTCGQGQTFSGYCPIHGNSYIFEGSGDGAAGGIHFTNTQTLRLEPYLIQA